MLGIGWTELLVLGIIALIFVGPKQLPELMKNFAKFASYIGKAKEEWNKAIREDKSLQDIHRSMNEVKDSFQKAGSGLKSSVDRDFKNIDETAKKLGEEIDRMASDQEETASLNETLNETTELYNVGEEPNKK